MGSPLELWLRQTHMPLCQLYGLLGDVEVPPLDPAIKSRLEEAHRKAVKERAKDGR